ncbi:MAG: amidohydrolase [Chloroflexi bacterium]|nr:amidohydrolase [Chloroflexota bacterium]
MHPGAPPADAVAVRGGQIIAVGAVRDVRELIGPATEVIELSGETLLPGFQDAHIHPIEGGLLADRCDLHPLADATAYLAAVERYAAAHPERPWVEGSGWSLSAFPRGEPGRELLDRIVPDRPAMLESNDGHVAWVNTRALELAGVTASTAEPADGRIARDEHGAPTGTLVDGAIDLVARHLPPPTHKDLLGGLRAAQQQLHALGITAWQDAHVEPANLAVYREAASSGWLTARVVAALWWDRERGLEQIEEFEEQRSEGAVGRLRADSVKLMLDGILESRTAFLNDPYTGTGDAGVPFIDPDLLHRAVVELDRRGFQAHFHAIGDGAIRLALDAIESARTRNGPGDRRHHISHLELIHPDDIPRFAALDAVANIQPFWAVDDDQMQELRIPSLGPDRAGWQFSFGSLARSGARLAAGSDWTVTTANPLLEIEVAVHRVPPDDRDAAPFLPDECLSLDEALAAFTIGSAWVNHLDRDTGSIEVGKLADLVILDRDLREADAGPIGEATVRGTWVEGERVF